MWLCRIGWLHLGEGYVVRTSVLFFVAVLVVLVVLGRLGQVVLRVLKLFARRAKTVFCTPCTRLRPFAMAS